MKIDKQTLLMFLQQLAVDGSDPECDHECADKFLLAFIDDEEIEEAFLAVKRWYA